MYIAHAEIYSAYAVPGDDLCRVTPHTVCLLNVAGALLTERTRRPYPFSLPDPLPDPDVPAYDLDIGVIACRRALPPSLYGRRALPPSPPGSSSSE